MSHHHGERLFGGFVNSAPQRHTDWHFVECDLIERFLWRGGQKTGALFVCNVS